MTPSSGQGRFEIGSLLQVLLSLYGFLSSLLAAAILLAFTLLGEQVSRLAGYSLQFVALAWVTLFLALLCLPSFGYALLRLLRKGPGPDFRAAFPTASAALLLWPLALALGSQLAKADGLAPYLLPLVTVLATALPLWWLVELARRGIPCGAQRSWGALIFALFFSNPLTMLLELLLLVALLAGAALVLNSGLLGGYPLARLEYLAQLLMQGGGEGDGVQKQILPLLSNPWVIFAGLSIFSGLIPLLEELCKSLAIWALLGRRLNTAEGLALGAIAGAGFALTETLTGLANPTLQDQWLTLVVGRTGTGLLHIATASLVGMGLAAAWRKGEFLRFGLAYFAAVTLHGLWNFFSLASGLAPFVLESTWAGRALSSAALAGMIVLAIVFILILLTANRRLRRSPEAAAVESLNRT